MFDFILLGVGALIGSIIIDALSSSFASLLGGVSSGKSARLEAEQAYLRHKAMAEQAHASRNRDQAAILAQGYKDDA